MLNGGEKAKIKNIVMAIKGEYPKILEIPDQHGLIAKNMQKLNQANTRFPILETCNKTFLSINVLLYVTQLN